MTAIIDIEWNGGPVFPDGLTCNWMLQRTLLDANDQPTRALVSVDITDAQSAAIKAKQYPTISWIGKVDAVDGRYLNVAEAAAGRVQQAFEARLEALTCNGYFDESLNVRIKGNDRAMKERWTPQSALVLNMRALGVQGTTPMTTFDFNDAPISMTMEQFQGLMARYGQWFFGKFAEAAQ